jgi:hypothetical protein
MKSEADLILQSNNTVTTAESTKWFSLLRNLLSHSTSQVASDSHLTESQKEDVVNTLLSGLSVHSDKGKSLSFFSLFPLVNKIS